jgi:hypothetical protein
VGYYSVMLKKHQPDQGIQKEILRHPYRTNVSDHWNPTHV